MQEHADNFGATALGTLVGLMVIIPTIPGWLGQALVTLAVGGVTMVSNHFIKRELNRRWPNGKRKEEV